jgi:Gdp/GTP exchange factor required for growth at low temperatures
MGRLIRACPSLVGSTFTFFLSFLEVFDALPPLPPSMHLEPLINVHKQRLVARTVKALVAGQHLASRLQYPVNRRLFQRCLRLRGLDPATLHRKLAMYPD